MSDQFPTSDNLQLSRVNFPRKFDLNKNELQLIALDKLFIEASANAFSVKTAELLRSSLSENSLKAFKFDLMHFAGWGGSVPASSQAVASYIGDQAGVLAVATIRRRIATLSKVHAMLNYPNPCKSAVVKATLRGLVRKHGLAQSQARPLLKEDLFAVLDKMGACARDNRDRALLLLGFAGGFRRSELVGLEVTDFDHARQGLIVTLRKSKTDQEGRGRKIGIPHGRTRHCPVAALESWITQAAIVSGPAFRPISRHGHIADLPLTGDAVSTIIRRRVAEAGFDPAGYSGHSLRAGFATSAAQAGISTAKIRAQTGHASDAVLARYIRDGELFVGNAAGSLL